MNLVFQRHDLDQLLQSLEELRGHCLAMEQSLKDEIDQVAPDYQPSARNLVHYLALRQHDVRELQRELSRLGLSSLGRLEGHTLAAIDAVIGALRKLRGGLHAPLQGEPPVGYEAGAQILERHCQELLGPTGKDSARIMVTMPSEAARRYALVRDLVAAVPAGFPVFTGSASTLLDALLAGACGGILAAASVVPEACIRLLELTREGRLDEARAIQSRLLPLARLLGGTYGVPAL